LTCYDNIKRKLNQHIAALLVDEDPLGLGRDVWRYRITAFKRDNPERFRGHETRICQDLLDLQSEVKGFWAIRKEVITKSDKRKRSNYVRGDME
jgi:hypothetical protein